MSGALSWASIVLAGIASCSTLSRMWPAASTITVIVVTDIAARTMVIARVANCNTISGQRRSAVSTATATAVVVAVIRRWLLRLPISLEQREAIGVEDDIDEFLPPFAIARPAAALK